MRSPSPVQTTAIACAAMAIAAFAAGSSAGHPRAGLALAAGLLIGSANGFLTLRALALGTAFQMTSILRLALLSLAGLGAGAMLGLDVAWLSLLGVAAAQLVLAVVAASLLLRR